MIDLRSWRYSLERMKGERGRLETAALKSETELLKLKQEREHLEKARLVIQEVSGLTQRELEFHVNELVSHALAAVFAKPYQFKLQFTVRREKTEADLIWERDGKEYLPSSGGVRDVSSLGLRIAFWSLRSPRTRPVLLLDEPFKGLKPASAQHRAAKVLRGICDSLGMQVIMVTSAETDGVDMSEYADRVFRVSIERGVSHVIEGH